MSDVLALARPELLELAPYQHAAWVAGLERLHANEMPWRAERDHSAAGLNRYPEPQPVALLRRLGELYDADPAQLLVGRGSDEAIDLLVRAFCRAGTDSILECPPTFGMYRMAASVQGAGIVQVPLRASRDFALDVRAVLDAWRPGVKLVFLCSPNNPTGNAVPERDLLALCEGLRGRSLLVVDEAYLEFCGRDGIARHRDAFPHLAVLRTLSKAYALAGARCGTLLAHREVIELLLRIIPPYAVPSPVSEIVLAMLSPAHRTMARTRVEMVLKERERLRTRLEQLPAVAQVWRSEANFLLVRCIDAQRVLDAALAAGLLIRDVRRQHGLEHCVRISIGTPEQNDRLIAVLEEATAESAT